jgi:hypothetical protein
MRAVAFNLTARGLSHIDAEIHLVLADLDVLRLPNDKLTDRCQFASRLAHRRETLRCLSGPWQTLRWAIPWNYLSTVSTEVGYNPTYPLIT